MTTINDLKNALGAGLGSRKNKYMIELSFKDFDSKKFNILCKSASLPERTIDTTSVYHHGRKYNIRSETNYTGTYEVTILDDDKLTLRKFFDAWMKQINDSKSYSTKVVSGSAQGGLTKFGKIRQYIDKAQNFYEGAVQLYDDVVHIGDKLKDAANSLISDVTGFNSDKPVANYQTELIIWQLSNRGEKVYGYKLQNVFPSVLGSVQYDDSELDTLVEYNVTFSFSEFEPVEANGKLIENLYH